MMAIMARVEKRSAEQQALDNLRQYILSGNVSPGSRLTEAAVAEQLGVSRATVRTGMHRLASEGILVQVPYTGWQVSAVTARDAWELWTLRGSLEGLAAKLVCQKLDNQGRQRIRAALDELRQAALARQIDAINDSDFRLHRALVEMSGHSRLLDQYIRVENQIRLYIASSNQLLGNNLLSIVDQHIPLVEALLSADSDRAQMEAWAHNETEGRKLIDSISPHNA